MEKYTQEEQVLALEGLVLSRGWRDFFRPRMVEVRTQELNAMVYVHEDPMDIRASRNSVRILDTILALDKEVKQLRADLDANPQEAKSVVDLPQEVSP